MHFLCCWPRALALHWPIDGAHFKAEIVGGAGQHAPRNHEQCHIEEVHAAVIRSNRVCADGHADACDEEHQRHYGKHHAAAIGEARTHRRDLPAVWTAG